MRLVGKSEPPAMPLATGKTLACYEILGPLGSGAMGEVYRARDRRLEREVAVKVLPEEVAGDEERLRRFEREAKTLASLNHPNVAQVFGIDDVDGVSFIAMELVPGEDLAQRLSRGALGLDDALDLCRQLAEGLEAAHEAGVVHRDLKPANVLVTPDGRVKVLDFGLAKPFAARGDADSGLSTEAGRVLGTPTYMAPEQARGRPVDRRVDVWAFGCILYECLTGRRAFEGETVTDILASVIEREPDLDALPRALPAPVCDLVARCLRKDPRRRLRDVGDARIVLEERGAADVESERRRPGRLLPLAAAWAVLATFAAVWFWQVSGPRGFPRIASIRPLTTSSDWATSASWSHEGEFIAYCQVTSNGFDVFVKPVTGGDPDLRVDDPGDDVTPRLSPDGTYLAYLSSSEAGCPVMLVAPHGDRRTTLLVETGISPLDLSSLLMALGDRPWSADGDSLLVTRRNDEGRLAVCRVDLDTRAIEPLTFPGPGQEDLAASLSFDGRRVVFQRQGQGGSDLWMMPADGSGEPSPLLQETPGNLNPAWRPDGERVVYRRSSTGGLYDVWEIDVGTGETRQITFETRRVWALSVSKDDRIAFSPSDHDTFLHSVPAEGGGDPLLLNAHVGDNFGASPSPVDERVAYHSSRTGDTEIWILDPRAGTESRITQDPAADLFPDWSPDGSELVYVSDAEGPFKMFVTDVRRGDRRLLVDQPLSVHGSNTVNATVLARWSPDATDPLIAYIVSGDHGYSLWTVRPDGSGARRVLDGVLSFDWYLDSRRGVAARQQADGGVRLEGVNLESGASAVLLDRACTELEVAPDGSGVSFSTGIGHTRMDVFVLPLAPPSDPDELPTPGGEVRQRTFGAGRWHVHNGGWTADSRRLVYTRDEDYGDVFELIESR